MENQTKKQPRTCPTKPFGEVRIAIVCDWLTNWGGAERCILEFHKIWPEAPIYTLIYNEKRMQEFKDAKIYTSYLQKMPLSKRKWQFYLNQMPRAIEQFDLSEYDIVLSNSHVAAKGIITKPSTLHICYLDSPTRYLWDYMHLYIKEMKITKIKLIDNLLKRYVKKRFHQIRIWDYIAGQRPDYIIAISNYIRSRTLKYYRRDTDIIYPPVNSGLYQPVNESEIENYYLIVGRQVAYKKTDIVIKAFNELGLPLVIIGEGPHLENLKKMAGENIKFLGRIPDIEVKKYYSHCRAFIFPQEEDFGITPLEAQSAGRPVIAYRAGGATETVIENETGIFFDKQTPEAIIEAVKKINNMKFDPKKIRNHAQKFDTAVFKEKIKSYVEEKWGEFNK